MQEAMHYLFHDGGSCRIETSPLICSANQWTVFCIIGTSVMKDSRYFLSLYTERLILHVVKDNFLFLFFFYLGFLSRILTIHRTAGEGEANSLFSFYILHPLHKHLHISWFIAVESSPLRIAGSRNRTWNLWYTLFRTHSFYT